MSRLPPLSFFAGILGYRSPATTCRYSYLIPIHRPGAGRRRLTLFLLAVVTTAYIGAMVPLVANTYDEGLIVCGAERILRGQHLYVDFNSGYPPGQFYTIALVFRLFGSSLLAERIWDCVWRLGVVAAAAWLACEFAGRNLRYYQLLPLACCAALVGVTGFHLYPMVSATLPFLCALSCALAFARTLDLRWIFSAGLLLGCTALYRHDLAACAAIVAIGSVVRNRRAIIRLASGILLVVAPAITYFATTVRPQILKQTFWDFPRLNAAARHIPLLVYPYFIWDLFLPMAVIGFAAFDASRTSRDRRVPLLILAAAAGLTLILATQRLDTVHAFPSLIVCLVILVGFKPSSLPREVLLACAITFYGVFPVQQWARQLWLSSTMAPSGIVRAGLVRIPSDQAQAVLYIQNHVPSGEKLYVGTTTHSRISLNDSLFPFLANRPQGTRYDMWIPGITNSAAVQLEVVHALESNVVRYVVLFDAPRSTEPNLSSVDSGINILDTYLNRRYREVAVFGHYHILERET